MATYVIQNNNDGFFLQGIELIRKNRYTSCSYLWTTDPEEALRFNCEEAHTMLYFIEAVIDWELAEQLEVEELKI